jgi:epoxyqueuosine reductase
VTASDIDELSVRVKAKARELGFDAVGIARADVPIETDHRRYEEFLANGMHGTMSYLAENASVRRELSTSDIMQGARSVVSVARRYQRSATSEASDPELARRVARYARGHDYHNVVRRKLRRLAVFLRGLGTPAEPARARPMVDDVPVLERAWAARGGLGFVGKNGMLIVPGEGSFVVLGEVVTTLELTPDVPMTERCGTCTRCLDACPTNAFARPFVLDPRKCIAYLTIELRGPIPESQREGVGEHLFGCDDCQTVCPFNGSTRTRDAASTETFEPLPLWGELGLADLLSMDEQKWRELSLGSPTKRAEAHGMARNAATVLGNLKDKSALPALARAAAKHPSEVVRDAAKGAIARILE